MQVTCTPTISTVKSMERTQLIMGGTMARNHASGNTAISSSTLCSNRSAQSDGDKKLVERRNVLVANQSIQPTNKDVTSTNNKNSFKIRPERKSTRLNSSH